MVTKDKITKRIKHTLDTKVKEILRLRRDSSLDVSSACLSLEPLHS